MNKDVKKLEAQKTKLELELAPILGAIEAIKSRADIWASRVLKLAFCTLFGQLSFFTITTFHVYGWDTMEPLTYLVQSAWIIAAYGYFLVNKTAYNETGTVPHTHLTLSTKSNV